MITNRVFGLDAFMNAASEGWSFVAFRTPIERLGMALRRRPEVLDYERNVRPVPLVGRPVIPVEPDRRRVFVLRLKDSSWTVLLRTVDWSTDEDALAVRRLAADLSAQLVTTAIASVGNQAGADCRLFDNGREKGRIHTSDLDRDFLEFFEEEEFFLPGCFIGCDGQHAKLYVQDLPLEYVERVDRLAMKAK